MNMNALRRPQRRRPRSPRRPVVPVLADLLHDTYGGGRRDADAFLEEQGPGTSPRSAACSSRPCRNMSWGCPTLQRGSRTWSRPRRLLSRNLEVTRRVAARQHLARVVQFSKANSLPEARSDGW